jgi:SAM-dependent methyltransferase
MPPLTTIYDNARHYDLLMPGPNDLPFYHRQLFKRPGPVLELGCGTGRLTIALAKLGLDISGLDAHPAMLEQARCKAADASANINFFEADCRTFSLHRRYAQIFFPNNSLSHVLTRKDVEATFRAVKQHLTNNGTFIVDLFTPLARLLAREPNQRYPVGAYDDTDGRGRVVVTERTEYDPATQVNHLTWYYTTEGGTELASVPLSLRMFYPQEIDALLEYNGFAIEDKFGNFDESVFGSASPKQLIVCRLR